MHIKARLTLIILWGNLAYDRGKLRLVIRYCSPSEVSTAFGSCVHEPWVIYCQYKSETVLHSMAFPCGWRYQVFFKRPLKGRMQGFGSLGFKSKLSFNGARELGASGTSDLDPSQPRAVPTSNSSLLSSFRYAFVSSTVRNIHFCFWCVFYGLSSNSLLSSCRLKADTSLFQTLIYCCHLIDLARAFSL